MVVPYTTHQMYDLINDVKSYPEFLPGCHKAIVHSHTEDEMRASISVAKGHFSYSFTSINRLQRNKIIEMRLLKGPFKHLEGYWRFDTLSGKEKGSKVSIDLEFEFSNLLLDLTFRPVLNKITKILVDAFYNRARKLYGS